MVIPSFCMIAVKRMMVYMLTRTIVNNSAEMGVSRGINPKTASYKAHYGHNGKLVG